MTTYLGDKPVGISSIVKQEVAKVKFGATVDTFIGDVDENGVLQAPKILNELRFDGVKDISENALVRNFGAGIQFHSIVFKDLTSVSGNYAADRAFYDNDNIVFADFGSLITISGRAAFEYIFYSCSNFSEIVLDKLEEITGAYALYYALYYTKITSLNLGSLKTISADSACEYLCNGCSELKTVDMKNLTTVSGNRVFYHAFYNCTKIASVDFGSLTEINGNTVFFNCFYQCSSIVDINIKKLKRIIGTQTATQFFYKCTSITSADLGELETINGTQAASGMFYGCSKLSSVILSNLKTVTGSSALANAFYGAAITRIEFPSLTTVGSDSFGTNMFNGCKQLIEIHFRADMQATIEAMSGYSSKWGATNATIYFDL